MINYNFKAFAIAVVFLIIGITNGIWLGIYWLLTPGKTIESHRPLTPTLKLEVVDNKVDTIYVYTQE